MGDTPQQAAWFFSPRANARVVRDSERVRKMNDVSKRTDNMRF